MVRAPRGTGLWGNVDHGARDWWRHRVDRGTPHRAMDVYRPDAARAWARYRGSAYRANARITAADLSLRGDMAWPHIRLQMKSACARRITVVAMLSTKRAGDFCVAVLPSFCALQDLRV